MGNFITRFIYGETDVNQNGIADNRELMTMLNTYLQKQNEKDKLKHNKKLLKKIIKQK